MADVDLRPMTLGEVLDRTFNLYKNNFWLFAGITALPFLVLLLYQIGSSAFQTGMVGSGGRSGFPSGAIAGVVAGVILGGLIYLLLIGAAQAATIFAVSDLYLGRQAGIRDVYGRVGSKTLRVLLILLLVGLACGVGFLLLIIPGFILLCRTAVSVPASMLEDTNPIASIERSMELTKGYAMQIFLIFLLVWVLSYIVAILFQMPFAFLEQMAIRAHHSVSFGTMVLSHLSTFLSEVLVGPIGTIAFSLMYYNLRVRKEAFDLQHLMARMGTDAAPGAPSIV